MAYYAGDSASLTHHDRSGYVQDRFSKHCNGFEALPACKLSEQGNAFGQVPSPHWKLGGQKRHSHLGMMLSVALWYHNDMLETVLQQW